jgi:hypothetical protein
MAIGHSKLVASKSQAKNYAFFLFVFYGVPDKKKRITPPIKKIPYAFALIVFLGRKYS